MEHLFEKLREYAAGDTYPYHMPGHKRRSCGALSGTMYENDITEIEGFDNLHQPEGILLELQKEAARLYGAQESFYLVNGSTCGLLSAVSAVLPVGGHILMARNCHRSVYHAAYLRNLAITYLYPPYLTEYDIFDAVTPWQVRRALETEASIGAVLIVSPTYEGRIADICKIADIVHEKGIPLIVDEAHGAHLGLAEGFAPNSCQLGADLVIHSVHKTLPALTQTALIHVSGSLVDRGRLKRFLHIYQSSSPSYLLMASIDNGLQFVKREGVEKFFLFRVYYKRMMGALSKCRRLKFLPEDGVRQDVGKLLISVKDTEYSGKWLYDLLLQKYHLQTEMASVSFVLAMFTVNDGEEAYRRMTEALLEIDGDMAKQCSSEYHERALETWEALEAEKDVLPLAAAWDRTTERVALEESVGRYVGEFVNRYPPGVPLLVPGERITEPMCRTIRKSVEQGLTVQGIELEGEKGIFLQVLVNQQGAMEIV